MRTIWKFELNVGSNKVKMPEASEVLAVGEQEGKIMLWAEVDGKSGLTERPFLVTGTGDEIDNELVLDYTGTVKIRFERVDYIWHVFEIL